VDAISQHRRPRWEKYAKEKGFIIIIPHAEAKAHWLNKVGTENVLAQLDYVKRNYNVDENKAFLSGFSDGASGAFWMAFHKPTMWAGFLPFSGNPVVPRMGPYQCYPRNLLNRPFHATNGGRDSLYPSAQVKKLIEPFKKLGVKIDWTDYPQAPHRWADYAEEEKPKAMDFVVKTVRNSMPTSITWETGDTETGRCDWVVINEIKDVGNNTEFSDVNLTIEPGPVKIGIYVDQEYNGVGVRVRQVARNSVASQAGLTGGDIITKLDDTDLKDFNDLRKVLGAKKHGDKITGEYSRGGETKKFSGQFPEQKSRAAYRRTKTTGSVEAKTDANTINVKVSNVAKYTLLVNREQFDLSQPIKVLTNGEVTFSAVVKPDLVFMLEQYARDNDRTMVYCAKIEITVPKKEAKDDNKEEESAEEGK
jgi:hypothetical protein